jgi:DNA polymerase I
MPFDITLPNVRKLLLTDPGYLMFEADLKGADAQVVAWEAEDEDLKAAFRGGLDIHAKNAEDMLGTKFTKEKGHVRESIRKKCKSAVHGFNYGAAPRTIAINLGWTVREADDFRNRWFSLHPGIRKWHERVQADIARSRIVTNAFGWRRQFFDRPDSVFTEALAWIPQSTVAINTYQGAFQLESVYWPGHTLRGYTPAPGDFCGLILQTHDSITFQFKLDAVPPPKEIAETLKVKIPYPDPLYIPWDLKCSKRSWGDMEKIA